MNTPELSSILEFAGQGLGTLWVLLAFAALGSVFAATNWLRLVMWQRFSTLLWQTVASHGAVLALVSWVSGFDLVSLAAWDAAIFAACYISYCAYLAQAHIAYLASLYPARYRAMSAPALSAELVLCFLDRMVYRAIYSWSDIVPIADRTRIPRR